MTIVRPIHEGWGDARRLRLTQFPLMTQLPKPSGAEDGVNARTGCAAKKFRYSAHSEPAATRRRVRRRRNRRNHVDAQGSVRCGQVATKSTMNPFSSPVA